MAKKVRLKTKAELADPAFRKRVDDQSTVLKAARAACEKLPKARLQYVLDVAADGWVVRWKGEDDGAAYSKERRKWEALRREFVKSADKPLEIHCFSCHYNPGLGMKPLLDLVKLPACDAGTALRLYWLNDPVFFTQYASPAECDDELQRNGMKMLQAIRRRFKNNDFKTAKIPFDPRPWIAADDVDLEVLDLPAVMLAPLPK